MKGRPHVVARFSSSDSSLDERSEDDEENAENDDKEGDEEDAEDDDKEGDEDDEDRLRSMVRCHL